MKHAKALTLSVASTWFAFSACSSDSPDAFRQVEQYVAPSASAQRIMSFDVVSDWSPNGATLGSSAVKTQGEYALSVTSDWWTEVVSVPAGELGSLGDFAGFDFFSGATESWGTVRLVMEAPAGNWFQLSCVGLPGCNSGGSEYDLASLPSGQWNQLRFRLNSLDQNLINETTVGVKFRIVISAAPGTRLLDHLRVDIGADDTGTGGSGGTGGVRNHQIAPRFDRASRDRFAPKCTEARPGCERVS